MTIYEIKERTSETCPYFFSRDSLRFFCQTLKSFKVWKESSTIFYLHAPMYARVNGKKIKCGLTERWFSTITNNLYKTKEDATKAGEDYGKNSN